MRDGDEQAFREPTADEAAVLAAGRRDLSAEVVSVGRGGVALKANASSLEFVKATVDAAGVVVSTDGKGARRDQ